MRTVVEVIMVIAIAGLAIQNAMLDRELSRWKEDCYFYGYTVAEHYEDGSVKSMRLKTPVEFKLKPLKPRRMPLEGEKQNGSTGN